MENHNPNKGNQDPGEDPFLRERTKPLSSVWEQGTNPPPPNPYYESPYSAMPKKSKLIAGLLAFFIPGTGHFYLGLMQKGLFIMPLFFLNIAAIPFTIQYYNGNNTYIPFVVLLSCMLPVIYFYNVFDALQSTDQVNAYQRAVQLGQIPMAPAGSDPLGRQPRGGAWGIALIAIGFFLFLISAKPAWLDYMFSWMGSYVGAVVLIGAGLLLFLTESKRR